MSTPTSLITSIPGDPDQVRRISAQLATVETRAREIESRLRAIESGVGPQMWRGQAADGFAALLAETGPDLTRLAASYGTASQALATYATELAAAQDAARTAAAEATTAAGDRDRARAERDSADADAFQHAAAADEARIRLDAVAAQDAEQRRGEAIARMNAAGAAIDQAEQSLQGAQRKADEAARLRDAAAARCIRELEEASIAGIDARNLTQGALTPDGPSPAAHGAAVAGEFADAVGKNMADDLRDKPVLHGTDLTIGGVAGGLVAGRISSLKKERDRLLRERARAEERYRAATGADRQFYANQVQEKSDAADALKRKSDDIGRRAGAKIGLAGAGISTIGIVYDVMHGKPSVKATVSGVGGAITAAYVGAAIGTLVPLPVLGTVLGAGVGWGAGLLMSGIIDAGYDLALPQGVKDTIENGTKPIDDALVGAGNAIGRAWDAIF